MDPQHNCNEQLYTHSISATKRRDGIVRYVGDYEKKKGRDQYTEESSKDHEGRQWAGVGSATFTLDDDGCPVVWPLSNDTGIVVLLVYWTWRCDLQDRLGIDMEKLDGIVL